MSSLNLQKDDAGGTGLLRQERGADLRFALPSHLIKVRHVRSIWIKCRKTLIHEIKQADNACVDTCDERRDLNEENELSGMNTLRKGKSISNFSQEAKTHVHIEKQESSSEIRQQLKLQNMNKRNFHDVFYSVSKFMDTEKPYYISRIFPAHTEVSEDIMLNVQDTSATVCIFVNHDNQWRQYQTFHVRFSLLVNLGTDINRIEEALQSIDNLLIIKLSDYCYYTLTDNPISDKLIDELQSAHAEDLRRIVVTNSFKQDSCSYDEIMSINNYMRCITDLESTKSILSKRIEDIVRDRNNFRYNIDQIMKQRNENENLRKLADRMKPSNAQLEQRRDELRNNKEQLMKKLKQIRIQNQSTISTIEEVNGVALKNERLLYEINIEKSRLARLLHIIFPIRLISGKHDFSLFGTSFPSSLTPHHYKHRSEKLDEVPLTTISPNVIRRLMQLPKSQIEKLNALIGYITILIITVFDAFGITPRYQMKFLGSNSYINDYYAYNKSDNDILEPAKRSTIYPLFICQNPTLTVKFTYGLFLLRKNIEQLYEIEGISRVDDFNLLTACEIWLTCVESYADVVFDAVVDVDAVDGEGLPVVDREMQRKSGKNASLQSGGSKNVSIEVNVNSVVQEYNHNFVSEERIKHIKRHLLRGISR